MSDPIFSVLGALLGDQSIDALKNPQYLDANGQPVAGQTPYNKPGFMDRVFHPDIVSQVGQYNNQDYSSKLEALSRLTNGATLAGPNMVSFPGQTPEQVASANLAFGGQGGLNQNVKDLAFRNTGAPGVVGTTLGQSDIVEAGRKLAASNFAASQDPTVFKTVGTQNAVDLQNTTGALNRAPTVNAGLDSRAVNALANSLHVEPLEIQNTVNKLIGEIGRNPTYQEVENRLLSNRGTQAQIDEQTGNTQLANIDKTKSMISNQIASGELDSKVKAALSATDASRIPMITGARENDLANAAHTAAFPAPDASPYYRTSTGQLARNPAYVNLMGQMQGKMNGGGSVNGNGAIPIGGGLNIVPAPMQQNSAPPVMTTPAQGPITKQKPIGTYLDTFDTTPVSQVKPQAKVEPKQQEQEQPIDTNKFLHTINTKKTGNQTMALESVARYLADNVPLPSILQDRQVGDSNVQVGTLKRIAALGFKEPHDVSVWKSALTGKNPSLSQTQVFDLLKQLPIEEQHKAFSTALHDGNYD